MPSPIEVAGKALRYWEQRQAAMSNNLANVSTNGFKAETVFAELMEGAAPVGGGGTDYRAGARQQTGRPMDVALEGDGFFVVRTPQGDRYTRNGSFSLDADGVVVDQGGNPVLADNGGPIMLPPGEITIQANGDVLVEGASLGTLAMETIGLNDRLVREGGSYFVPPQQRQSADPDEIKVHQGQLEESNVNTVSSMVEMMGIQRNHAALQQLIRVADGVDGRAANDIARIG